MLDTVNLYHLQGTPTADILDRQHLQIKQRQQDLRTAIIIGMSMDQIVARAKDLIRTTLYHFESEEGVMDAAKFHGLTPHRHLHAEMIESLKGISCDLERSQISGAMELMRFFEGRLTYHLDVEDAAFERELGNITK